MAKKISALDALGAQPDAADLIPIVDNSTGITKYVTYGNLIGTSLTLANFAGYLRRPTFAFSSTTAISIGACTYELDGTQIVACTSALAFTAGSGGSNAGSTDLGADEIHYVYLDESAIGSDTTIVAGDILNSTTAPSFSGSKGGFYNGNDRCIFAFLTNSSSQIREFFHDGGRYVHYANPFEDLNQDVDATTWVEVPLTIPAFATRAWVMGETQRVGNSEAYTIWRTHDQASAAGQHILTGDCADNGVLYARSPDMVYTSADQSIEVLQSAAGSSKTLIYTKGYFLPQGM